MIDHQEKSKTWSYHGISEEDCDICTREEMVHRYYHKLYGEIKICQECRHDTGQVAETTRDKTEILKLN